MSFIKIAGNEGKKWKSMVLEISVKITNFETIDV